MQRFAQVMGLACSARKTGSAYVAEADDEKFVSLYLVRDRLKDSPEVHIQSFLQGEKERYAPAKEAFDEMSEHARRLRLPSVHPEGSTASEAIGSAERNNFFGLDEFSKWRESTDANLERTYKMLMEVPSDVDIDLMAEVEDVIRALGMHQQHDHDLDGEEKWAVQLHEAELLERYGGPNLVDETFLPLGVLTTMRKKRVT